MGELKLHDRVIREARLLHYSKLAEEGYVTQSQRADHRIKISLNLISTLLKTVSARVLQGGLKLNREPSHKNFPIIIIKIHLAQEA